MDNIRVLNAYINQWPVGVLKDTNGVWSFEYTQSWIREGFPLSPALPLQTEILIDGSTYRQVQNFFDNLLPEETARRLMAADAGIDVADRFGLIEYYGAESAGAITLLPSNEIPIQNCELQLLDFSMLSARIKQLPKAALTKGAPKRMSLAGAQHKLAICFAPETSVLNEPVGETASTHILKPDHNDTVNYPHSVMNEWFVMKLAALAGLDVPSVHHLHVPEAVYLIERFDRTRENGTLIRNHILDGCQMLMLPPESKYRDCTVENLIKLGSMCNEPAATRKKLFNWLVFNFLTGNGDAHLKNLSFFAAADGYILAPHYDLLNTSCYGTSNEWMRETMVTALDDVVEYQEVNLKTLLNVAIKMKVGAAKNIEKDLRAMCQKVMKGAESLYKKLEDVNEAQADLMRLTPGEFRQLRSIIYGPIKEACDVGS